MIQHKCWALPELWEEVVVTGDTMMHRADRLPNDITEWCHCYFGHSCWHLHGYESTKEFAFRFEDFRDATVFKLRWV